MPYRPPRQNNKLLGRPIEEMRPKPDEPEAPQYQAPLNDSFRASNLSNPESRNLFSDQIEDEYRESKEETRMMERDISAGIRAGKAALDQKKKARNFELENKFQSTGQKSYTDAYGNIQPKIDARTGKPLFTEDTGPIEYDEKTGKPFRVKRNQYGEVKKVNPDKNAPVGYNPKDPNDRYIYRKNKHQPWEAIDPDKGIHSNDESVRQESIAHLKRLRKRELLKDRTRLIKETRKNEKYDLTDKQRQDLREQARIYSEPIEKPQGSDGFLGFGKSGPDPEALKTWETEEAGRKKRLSEIQETLDRSDQYRAKKEKASTLLSDIQLLDLKTGDEFASEYLASRQLTTDQAKEELAQKKSALDEMGARGVTGSNLDQHRGLRKEAEALEATLPADPVEDDKTRLARLESRAKQLTAKANSLTEGVVTGPGGGVDEETANQINGQIDQINAELQEIQNEYNEVGEKVFRREMGWPQGLELAPEAQTETVRNELAGKNINALAQSLGLDEKLFSMDPSVRAEAWSENDKEIYRKNETAKYARELEAQIDAGKFSKTWGGNWTGGEYFFGNFWEAIDQGTREWEKDIDNLVGEDKSLKERGFAIIPTFLGLKFLGGVWQAVRGMSPEQIEAVKKRDQALALIGNKRGEAAERQIELTMEAQERISPKNGMAENLVTPSAPEGKMPDRLDTLGDMQAYLNYLRKHEREGTTSEGAGSVFLESAFSTFGDPILNLAGKAATLDKDFRYRSGAFGGRVDLNDPVQLAYKNALQGEIQRLVLEQHPVAMALGSAVGSGSQFVVAGKLGRVSTTAPMVKVGSVLNKAGAPMRVGARVRKAAPKVGDWMGFGYMGGAISYAETPEMDFGSRMVDVLGSTLALRIAEKSGSKVDDAFARIMANRRQNWGIFSARKAAAVGVGGAVEYGEEEIEAMLRGEDMDETARFQALVGSLGLAAGFRVPGLSADIRNQIDINGFYKEIAQHQAEFDSIMGEFAPDILRDIGRRVSDIDTFFAALDGKGTPERIKVAKEASEIMPAEHFLALRQGRENLKNKQAEFEAKWLPVLSNPKADPKDRLEGTMAQISLMEAEGAWAEQAQNYLFGSLDLAESLYSDIDQLPGAGAFDAEYVQNGVRAALKLVAGNEIGAQEAAYLNTLVLAGPDGNPVPFATGDVSAPLSDEAVLWLGQSSPRLAALYESHVQKNNQQSQRDRPLPAEREAQSNQSGDATPQPPVWTARGQSGSPVQVQDASIKTQSQAERELAARLPEGEMLDTGSVQREDAPAPSGDAATTAPAREPAEAPIPASANKREVIEQRINQMAPLFPNGVVMDPNLKRSGIATKDGALRINLDQFEKTLEASTDFEATLDAYLREEFIHVAAMEALSDIEVADLWEMAPDDLKSVVRRAYHANKIGVGGQTEAEIQAREDSWEMGHELLRMIIQDRENGIITEATGQDRRFSGYLIGLLKKLSAYLRGALDKTPGVYRAVLEDSVAQVNSQIAKLENPGDNQNPDGTKSDPARSGPHESEQQKSPPLDPELPASNVDEQGGQNERRSPQGVPEGVSSPESGLQADQGNEREDVFQEATPALGGVAFKGVWYESESDMRSGQNGIFLHDPTIPTEGGENIKLSKIDKITGFEPRAARQPVLLVRDKSQKTHRVLPENLKGPQKALQMLPMPVKKERRTEAGKWAIHANPHDRPDTWSVIADNVGIMYKSKKNRGGEYDGAADLEALPRQYRIQAFARKGEGLTPDKMHQAMVSEGVMTEDTTVNDMWVQLVTDARERIRGPVEENEGGEAEAQFKEFERRLLFPRPKAKSVPVSNINVGDTLRVDDDYFRVVNFDPENFTLVVSHEDQDGVSKELGEQFLHDDQVTYPDEIITKKQDEGVPAENMPFGSSRSETNWRSIFIKLSKKKRAGEELTAAQQRMLDESERRIGQTMMFDGDREVNSGNDKTEWMDQETLFGSERVAASPYLYDSVQGEGTYPQFPDFTENDFHSAYERYKQGVENWSRKYPNGGLFISKPIEDGGRTYEQVRAVSRINNGDGWRVSTFARYQGDLSRLHKDYQNSNWVAIGHSEHANREAAYEEAMPRRDTKFTTRQVMGSDRSVGQPDLFDFSAGINDNQGKSNQENLNAPTTNISMEPSSSQESYTQESLFDSGRGQAGSSDRPVAGENDGPQSFGQGNTGNNDSTTPLGGTRGTSGTASSGSAGNEQPAGGGISSQSGVSPESWGDLFGYGASKATGQDLGDLGQGSQSDQIKALQGQIIPGDRNNIEATLPQLLAEQRDDVFKAETRFSEEATPGDPKRGILFTNGTGTGKTFTGMGVVARQWAQGKRDILIVAPSQKVVRDWINTAKLFGVPLNRLASTSESGKDAVITTYANFASNPQLLKRTWDTIVYDESHKLLSNAEGTPGSRFFYHQAHTNIPEGKMFRARRIYEIDNPAPRSKDFADRDLFRQAAVAHESAIRDFAPRVAHDRNPNVVFLSATPFSYHKPIRYADGFLFNSPPVPEGGAGYNQATGFDRFLVENFGYRMRQNRLTEPPAEVDTTLMERQFNQRMKESGALSGRMLTVEQDYSREFVLIDSVAGRELDRGFHLLNPNTGDQDQQAEFAELKELFNNYWYRQGAGYARRMQLLESAKVVAAIPRIRQHLEMGRKVLLGHNYNNADPRHPFRLDYLLEGREPGSGIEQQIRQWEARHPELVDLDLRELVNPHAIMRREFGSQLGIYNGNVSDAHKESIVQQYNSDNGAIKIIMGQIESIKEGVSLHDTTGKNQRVLMSAGLPIKPTDAIQLEGRNFRVGVESNAIQEYLVLHTDMERTIYSERISRRVSTAENLAMGDIARRLLDTFTEGYLSPTNTEPNFTQGIGGKEYDRRQNTMDPFELAMTYYYANQRRNSQNRAAEGRDYFATPEPLGLKMVNWLGLQAGEKGLEPSAGHGAISRFFPDYGANHFIEPSGHLSPLVRLRSAGEVHEVDFENYHISNKFHGIAMNPPFGHGGKTAIDHVSKAANHLYEGGRLVAIIPDGPSAQKHLDTWMASKEFKPFHLRKQIQLPAITFDRAGTRVNTKILVIDRMTKPGEMLIEPMGDQDFRDIDSIDGLFEQIRDMDLGPRLEIPEGQRGNVDLTDRASVLPERKTSAGFNREAFQKVVDRMEWKPPRRVRVRKTGKEMDVYDAVSVPAEFVQFHKQFKSDLFKLGYSYTPSGRYQGASKWVPVEDGGVGGSERSISNDALYMKLAKDPGKNREALQKMVDAAAKAAGIKFADPVTYDKQRNIIPLSKRFDSSEDSILYAGERGYIDNTNGYFGVLGPSGHDFLLRQPAPDELPPTLSDMPQSGPALTGEKAVARAFNHLIGQDEFADADWFLDNIRAMFGPDFADLVTKTDRGTLDAKTFWPALLKEFNRGEKTSTFNDWYDEMTIMEQLAGKDATRTDNLGIPFTPLWDSSSIFYWKDGRYQFGKVPEGGKDPWDRNNEERAKLGLEPRFDTSLYGGERSLNSLDNRARFIDNLLNDERASQAPSQADQARTLSERQGIPGDQSSPLSEIDSLFGSERDSSLLAIGESSPRRGPESMSLKDWRKDPRSLQVGPHSAFSLDLFNMQEASDYQNFSNNQLDGILGGLGVSRSGPRDKKIKRILHTVKWRHRLGALVEADNDKKTLSNIMGSYSSGRLSAILKQLGQFVPPGDHRVKAAAAANWVLATRSQGTRFVTKQTHLAHIDLAIRKGWPVSVDAVESYNPANDPRYADLTKPAKRGEYMFVEMQEAGYRREGDWFVTSGVPGQQGELFGSSRQLAVAEDYLAYKLAREYVQLTDSLQAGQKPAPYSEIVNDEYSRLLSEVGDDRNHPNYDALQAIKIGAVRERIANRLPHMIDRARANQDPNVRKQKIERLAPERRIFNVNQQFFSFDVDTTNTAQKEEAKKQARKRKPARGEKQESFGFDGYSTNPARLIKNNRVKAEAIAANWPNIKGGRSEAKSIARAALVKAAQAYTANDFDRKGPFEPYAMQSVRNALTDAFRHQKLEYEIEGESMDAGTGEGMTGHDVFADEKNTGTYTEKETIDILNDAILNLPDTPRRVVNLHLAGMSYKDIGDEIKKSKTEISRIFNNALEVMRKRIEARGYAASDLFGAERDSDNDQNEIRRMLDSLEKDLPSPEEWDKFRKAAHQDAFDPKWGIGGKTLGDPKKANPATDPATRVEFDVVHEFRKYNTERETHQQWIDEARRMVKTDRAGVIRDLLERAEAGEAIDRPELVKAAQLVVPQMMREAVASGDRQALRDAQVLAWAYDAGGTEQARAFAARHDPHLTPEERHSEFLVKMIFTPEKKIRNQIEQAPTPAAKSRRIAELERQLAKREGNQIEVQQELKAVRSEKDKAEILTEANSARLEKIEKALADMGVTLSDIFNGDAKVVLKGSAVVQNTIGSFSENRQKAISMMIDGWPDSEISKKSKLTKNQLKAVKAQFRKMMEDRFTELVDRGFTLDDFDPKQGFGISGSERIEPRKVKLSPQERKRRVKELMDALMMPDKMRNSGKLKKRRKKRVGKPGYDPTKFNNPSTDPVPYEGPFTQTFTGGDVTEAYEFGFDLSNRDQVIRVGRAIETETNSSGFDWVYEHWINFILAGPQTHIVNITGNATAAAVEYSLQRGMEIAVNMVVRDPMSPQLGEVKYLLRGLIPGIMRGLHYGVRAFDTESDIFESEVLNSQVDIHDFDKAGNIKRAVGGKYGRAVRIPGRFLQFMDNWFKGAIGQVEVGAVAYRMGRAKGLKGPQLENFIRSEVNLPGSYSWSKSVEKARELTFQTRLKSWKQGGAALEGFVRMLQDARTVDTASTSGRVGQFILGLILPFVRTPFNIYRMGLRKSPLGSAEAIVHLGQGLYSVAKGKPFIEGYPKARMVKEISEQLIAWVSAFMIYDWIEGDDDDEDKPLLITGSRPYNIDGGGSRQLLERTSGGTFQIRIGGRDGFYLDYGRIEPLATTLGTVVDTVRAAKSKEPTDVVIGKMASYFMAGAQEKTFLSGLAGVTKSVEDSISDPSRVGRRLKKFATSAIVPNLIKQPLRNLDDYARDYYTADTPYFMLPSGSNAEKRYDIYGNPIEKQGSPLLRVFWDVGVKPYKEIQPADKLIKNWNSNNPDEEYFPARPYRSYYRIENPEGEFEPMTAKQVARLDKRAGEIFSKKLSGWLSPLNVKRPRKEDIDRIKKDLSAAREQAKKEITRKPGKGVSQLMGWN